MWSDKLRLNSMSMLQMHQPFCKYGDADSLPPQYSTHISDQSTAILFARRNLKPNRGICYNRSKLARKKKIVPESLHWLQEQQRFSHCQNYAVWFTFFLPVTAFQKTVSKTISLKRNARIFFRVFVTRLFTSIYAKPNLSEGEALRVDLSFATASAM